MTTIVRAVAFAAAVVAAGCGGDAANCIDGSLSASYDMDFDKVRIRRYTTEVSVEYIRDRTAGEDTVLKLTVSFEENDIRVGQWISLHEPSGTVTRVTTDTSTFPDLCPEAEGRPSHLKFTEYGSSEGDTIEGEWRLCFANGLDGVGCFQADLDVID